MIHGDSSSGKDLTPWTAKYVSYCLLHCVSHLSDPPEVKERVEGRVKYCNFINEDKMSFSKIDH